MDISTATDLETKAGIPPEAVVTHAEMMRAFEAFKEANEERLAEITRRGGDVVLEEKLARINSVMEAQARKLDELLLKAARPAIGADRGEPPNAAAREHKAAFDAYMRSGDATALRALELKAMSVGSAADGGYLAPPEVEAMIGERLATLSPVRALATVRTISSTIYKKPVVVAGPAVGWVGETDPRAQTAAPVLDELSFPAMELYAQPAATATLLEDAAVNIDAWLAQEVEQAFAAQEGAAFVSGDGSNKPRGFLAYPVVDNAAWSWGNIGYVASGTAGAFPASNPSDVLIDLVYAVKAGYRQNGVFVMNRKTQSVVRKFKDSTGNYLWQPPVQAGGRPSLMTFPVIEAEDMPDIGANSLSIAFGDFKRGYLIVDRTGVSVLRDPYSAKPYVLFYTTKRVGGGVQDFDAIKLLRFAAS
jgi:HK97 family phage major capsid protein